MIYLKTITFRGFIVGLFSALILQGAIPQKVWAQGGEDYFMVVEEMPQLKGGMDTLQNNLEYPKEAAQKGITGRVSLRFVVTEKGETTNFEVVRGVGSGCDEAAQKAVKRSDFTPGKQRGESVNVLMTVHLMCEPAENQKEDKNPPPPSPEDQNKEQVYTTVEEMPVLKGGMPAVYDQLKYPQTAKNAGIEGRVILQFTVNTEGKAQDIQVLRGIGAGCDEAAVDAIQKVEFEPGVHRGKKVSVRKSLPLTFNLND